MSQKTFCLRFYPKNDYYQKEIGGLSRAGTVLNELVEEIDFDKFTPDFLKLFPVTAIQRFGYLLDEVMEQNDKAKILLEKVKQAGIKFRKTPLKSEIQPDTLSEYEQNEIWKIVINKNIHSSPQKSPPKFRCTTP